MLNLCGKKDMTICFDMNAIKNFTSNQIYKSVNKLIPTNIHK